MSVEKTEKTKKKITIKDACILQAVVIIYTMAGVMGKFASSNGFLSWNFVLFYGAEIAILGVYAILWQQIIKKIDLSIAYANRAIALLWSMIWAVVFFHESITVKNLIGVVIVIIGIIIINGDVSE